MTDDEKKKRVVDPAPRSFADDDPDAPPSADEIAESERLRRELENPATTHEAALLAAALKRALEPKSLSEDEHRALLDRALRDVDAPASDDEIERGERLRDELDDPGSTHPDVQLARALRLAVQPRALEAATHRKILDHALGEPRARRMRVTWTTIFVAAAAAAAIAVIKLPRVNVGSPTATWSAANAGMDMIKVHSVDDLFGEPFPKDQPPSARIDRLAEARARDLRANRFAKWGVP